MKLKDIFSKLPPLARILLLLAALAIGVALLIFGGGSGEETALPYGEDTEKYAAELETKISELCLQVEGVSDVTVAVSLSGGFEYVYATDASGRPVTSNGGAGIIIKTKTPEIAGIGIVCSGGGDINVKNRLVSLVSAAFGVGSNRIFVTEAKKGARLS